MQVQPAKYISELLFRFDCVIVPELGGFVANYASASIHPGQHIFTPPSKNIVFNRNLNNNDGLLANAIASEANISYEAAVRELSYFAKETLKALTAGGRVLFDDIGTLYLDVEKNIQFEPAKTVNYLTDSFGLEQFTSAAILRDYQQRRAGERIDREVVPAKRKLPVRKYVALTLSAMALLAAVYIPVKTDLLKNIETSSLNIFSKKTESKYTSSQKGAPVFSSIDEQSQEALNDTASVFTMNLTDDGKAVYVNSETPGVESVAPITAVVSESYSAEGNNFHIIVGAFKIPSNADNYVLKLKENGLDAYLISKNDGGLTHVALGSFPTKQDAVQKLANIRSGNPDAWLLKK